MNLESPSDVVRFWFGDILLADMNNLNEIENRMPIWFGGASQQFDDIQRMHSHLLYNDTLIDSWDGTTGLLARIILYDQFPRLIFRGKKEAFHFDPKAIDSAMTIVENSNLCSSFSAIELFFVGVCLQHSEELHHQEIGLQIAEIIKNSTPRNIAEYISSLKGYPHEHYEVILKFGRFPSRNIALGRAFTPEESEWLASPNCPAWARSQIVLPQNVEG